MKGSAEPWRRLIESIGSYYRTQLLTARERGRRAVRPHEEQLEAIAGEGQSVGVDTEPLIPRELVLEASPHPLMEHSCSYSTTDRPATA